MTDLGVLFRPEMIRAMLEGRKTMTRRPAWRACNDGAHKPYADAQHVPTRWRRVKPGDRLWARETIRVNTFKEARYAAGNDHVGVYARLREQFPKKPWDKHAQDFIIPGIHMPRWASRITWDVTAVRMERLQDITEEDARAEGVEFREGCWGTWDQDGTMRCGGADNAREAFRCLWLNIHGIGTWDSNPEVVVISGKVYLANIDKLKETA